MSVHILLFFIFHFEYYTYLLYSLIMGNHGNITVLWYVRSDTKQGGIDSTQTVEFMFLCLLKNLFYPTPFQFGSNILLYSPGTHSPVLFLS